MFEIGSTPPAWRPATGPDSVPFPDACWGEGPAADAAWHRYWKDCAEAERHETADEAIVRCRAEAEQSAGGAARFDHVLAHVVGTFDHHERELAGPDAEARRGMTLEMLSPVVNFSLNELHRSVHELDKTFAAVDRDRYRKAAATFAKIVADLSMGMAVSAANAAGGAT